MKKMLEILFLTLAMFLLILFITPETKAIFNFTYDNITDQNYVKSRLDLENSSVLFNFVENQTEVGKEWVCRYDNAPDIPSCIGKVGNVFVNTSSEFGSAIFLKGGDEVGVSASSIPINYTLYALVASNFPASGSGTISVKDKNGIDRERLLLEAPSLYFLYRNMTVWLGTTVRIPPSNNKFMFIKMAGNNVTLRNLSNVQGGYWDFNFSKTPVTDYTQNYTFFSAAQMQLDYVRLVNWTPTTNESGNKARFAIQRFSTAQISYNISYMGSVPEEGANFTYNISCDNGTNWVSGTPTSGGENRTKVTCFNNQNSSDFLLEVIGNVSWEGIFVTRIETTIDATLPRINMSLNDTTLSKKDGVNVSANVSDDTGLSFCKFIINQTGVNQYFNESLSGTDDECDQNFTIALGIGGVINFTVVVNDTSNNTNQSSTVILIGDTTAPTLFANSTQGKTSFTTSEKVNITINVTDDGVIDFVKVTINKSDVHTNYTMRLLVGDMYQFADTFAVGNYNIPYFYAQDNAINLKQQKSILSYTVTSVPTPTPEAQPELGGGGAGGATTPTCRENEVLIGNECVNASLFNVTFKVIGLKNIEPIVIYRPCLGGGQEWRYTIRTNKIIKSASFEKPNDFNTTIMLNNVLVTKELQMFGRFTRRVDAGKLRIVDTSNQVVFVDIGLNVYNFCYFFPFLHLGVIGTTVISVIYRKKIKKFIKETNNKIKR